MDQKVKEIVSGYIEISLARAKKERRMITAISILVVGMNAYLFGRNIVKTGNEWLVVLNLAGIIFQLASMINYRLTQNDYIKYLEEERGELNDKNRESRDL